MAAAPHRRTTPRWVVVDRGARPPMSRKILVFVIVAVALAALFVRLGFWQLDRLRERRAHNASLAAQLALPPASFEALPADGHMRRAWVEGTPDWDHEFVQTGRSLNGSPGVYVLTPVKREGRPAVLVNRGWVYAPDAATVDLARWRESRARFSGYTMAPQGADVASPASRPRATRVVTPDAVARLVPYATEPLVLVVQDSGGSGAPVRLPAVTLDDGPHLSYAIQWFCFAAIALVGAAVVAIRARRPPRAGSTAA